ncbi:hypothetical protein Bca4012_085114 [Brassica carinata]|uniref:Uncharacterized protein n=1 Tax=Brassica carinata TaxID=52824 RepID=A0A8X7SG19_BRACI|nr:hypothetical protein Bca52824_025326 [Brassica carinata]
MSDSVTTSTPLPTIPPTLSIVFSSSVPLFPPPITFKKFTSTKKPAQKAPIVLTITAPSSPTSLLSPSEFMEKKKLKRSRSDPSFDSPPHSNACTTTLPKGV